MIRKFISFLTVIILSIACGIMSNAATFVDIDAAKNEYLAKSVDLLSNIGVIKGTSDTTYSPDELVTREQMAAFIYRLMKKGTSVEGGENTTAFADLEDSTFFFMISWANTQGIIKGTSANTFNPKGTITLQDAYTMLVRALGYEKEETLAYPYDYIEIASNYDVKLNKGLDLVEPVNFLKPLTRGEVAVLLYNTFFAKTGIAETKQVEREIGTGANATWVLETVTEYPAFCAKYFDVAELEYQAIATPNYVFDTDETTAELGYEAIEFKAVGRNVGPAQFYADFAELGLTGEANDYIMSHFTIYATIVDNEIEKILYAKPLIGMFHTMYAKLETVNTNTINSYIDIENEVKKLSGKINVYDDKYAYFYGAPHSYLNPKYSTDLTKDQITELRNSNNLKFIKKVLINEDEYTYEIIGGVETDVELIEALKAVYTNGYYTLSYYDVNGDDIYDYIEYLPSRVYFVDTNENKTFADDGIDGNVAYVNEAVIDGCKFKDGDLVYGYFNPELNYIRAITVIKPVEGTITKIEKSTGTITINNKTKVSVVDGWKLLESDPDLASVNYVVKNYEWDYFSDLLTAGALNADVAKFYIYDGILVHQEGIESSVKFDKNLLVVTPDEDGNVIEEGAFIPNIGRTTYVYAWVDGTEKYIPVETKISAEDYVGKIATYSQDENGLYTIELLGYAVNEDDEYIGIDWLADVEFDDKKEIQAYNEYAEGYLVKNSGNRFRLRDGASRADSAIEDFDFIINDNTTILIKNVYEDVTEFVEIKELKDTIKNKLTNIQVIISNNIDYSTRENLVLLYAEIVDEKFEYVSKVSSKSERVVRAINVAKDSDGKFYAVYSLLNPYTGKIETNVSGTNLSTDKNYSSKYAIGDIITIASGKVADKPSDNKVGNIFDTTYLISEYVEEDNLLILANEEDEIKLSDDGIYVSVLGSRKYSMTADLIKWDTFKSGDINKLDGSDKSYLSIGLWAKDENSTLKTVYAKNVRAYVSENGDYIIVIVNKNEDTELCNLK